MPGVYSCAIDSFIEMTYHVLFPKLEQFESDLNPFNSMLVRACQRYREISLHAQIYRNQPLQMLLSNEVRESIWNVIIQTCNSFRARDSNLN